MLEKFNNKISKITHQGTGLDELVNKFKKLIKFEKSEIIEYPKPNTQKRIPYDHSRYLSKLYTRKYEIPETKTISYLCHPNGYDVIVVGTHPFSLQSNSILSKAIDNLKPDAFALSLCKCDYNMYCAVISGVIETPIILKEGETRQYVSPLDRLTMIDHFPDLICLDNLHLIDKLSQIKNVRVFLINDCKQIKFENEHYLSYKNDFFHGIYTSYLPSSIRGDIYCMYTSFKSIPHLTLEEYDDMLKSYKIHMDDEFIANIPITCEKYVSRLFVILDTIKYELKHLDPSYIPLIMTTVRMPFYEAFIDNLYKNGFTTHK